MGLLDKVESNEKDVAKKADAKAKKVTKATPVKEEKPAPIKEKKEKKAKKQKVKKPRPAGLSSEFEIAPKLSRVISWWVNFLANFSVLIAALFMSAFTGGKSGGLETTILFIIAIVVLFFNAIFLLFTPDAILVNIHPQLDTSKEMVRNHFSFTESL